MSIYNSAFAMFYDRLTENAEYEVRSEYISNFFSELGNVGKAVLDLACGTGTVSRYFYDNGFNVTGIDLSCDMLSIAKDKCPEAEFFCADMTDFQLSSKVDLCICCLDAINHLVDENQVINCFRCVKNSLAEGGIFIFDVNTVYKHREILADNTFIFDEDDYYIVWDNEHIDDRNVRVLIDMFIFNGSSYDRRSEEFTETAYEIDELKKMLYDSGFSSVEVYDELTENKPRSDSERLYFVCKKD